MVLLLGLLILFSGTTSFEDPRLNSRSYEYFGGFLTLHFNFNNSPSKNIESLGVITEMRKKNS